MPNRWIFPVAVVVSLAGCEQGPLDASMPPAPPPRPSVACDEVARTAPSARWEDTGAWSPGALTVTDAGRLGGPLAPPARLEARGAPGARVLVVDEARPGGGTERRAVCVQLRLAPGEPAAWREGPAVTIDTGLLLVGDEGATRRALRTSEAPVVPCLEGPAEDLDRSVRALASRGLTLAPVLPTLRCLEGARPPFDLEPLRAAMREQKAEGRAFLEARSPAWPLLAALGDRPWTRLVPAPDAPPVALVVEVRSGDGAYPVRLGRDGGGQDVLAEIALR